MAKHERIVQYTTDEIEAMRRRGEDLTDEARLDAMTEADLEAAVDADDEGDFDWSLGQVGIPRPQQQISVVLDRDVIDWFKAQGNGYQTRINAVLRGFVETHKP